MQKLLFSFGFLAMFTLIRVSTTSPILHLYYAQPGDDSYTCFVVLTDKTGQYLSSDKVRINEGCKSYTDIAYRNEGSSDLQAYLEQNKQARHTFESWLTDIQTSEVEKKQAASKSNISIIKDSTGYLRVSFDNAEGKTASLKVINTSGRTVMYTELSSAEERINISQLTKGTYSYRVSLGKALIGSGEFVQE